MTARTNRQWILTARPQGDAFEDCLAWREQPVPEPGPDQVLVRTIYLSMDPSNRIWMQQASYIPAVPLGEPMWGVILGEVVESRNPRFRPGDLVTGMGAWADYCLSDGKGLGPVPRIPGLPLQAFTGVLGPTGLTAYFGLYDIGRPQPGETVVVTAAAGAVGSMVGQFAKLRGCRAVGICGSDEKARWLVEELGFDAALNYRGGPAELRRGLKAACPSGIDVYFENVGGWISEVAYGFLNLRARIPLCGLISQYNAAEPQPGPRNMDILLVRRCRMEGFIVLDYMDRAGEMLREVGPWLADGRLKWKVDVDHGLETAPRSLRKLFSGGNTGKLVVQVGEEPAA
ncbi:NADP-dependent oxidoreductase [Rhodocista pekingensis]|uniref:NADP-dependent oxidoreductase n=1 Tax=Rhodocista pekingensis TaxID=201185 RepID=A0ABW2KTU3_9PROT